jgi:hypothetical protein
MEQLVHTAISTNNLPWLIIAVLIVFMCLPKSNGGKTDLGSRILGLLGVKTRKSFEDVEKGLGVVGDDGFDNDLYRYRIERLASAYKSKDSANE